MVIVDERVVVLVDGWMAALLVIVEDPVILLKNVADFVLEGKVVVLKGAKFVVDGIVELGLFVVVKREALLADDGLVGKIVVEGVEFTMVDQIVVLLVEELAMIENIKVDRVELIVGILVVLGSRIVVVLRTVEF